MSSQAFIKKNLFESDSYCLLVLICQQFLIRSWS
uniref:Uncharacterized protein n=1 Tax=Anguilla anguilla TaxID=7936 RepID=A0A0E9S9Y2_ANGAN